MLDCPKVRRSCRSHWSWLVFVVTLGCGTTTEPAPKAMPTLAYGVETRPNTAPLPQPASSAVIAPPQTKTAAGPLATPTPPAPAWDPGLANLDPSDDSVVGPPDAVPDCEARLKAAGVSFRIAETARNGDGADLSRR